MRPERLRLGFVARDAVEVERAYWCRDVCRGSPRLRAIVANRNALGRMREASAPPFVVGEDAVQEGQAVATAAGRFIKRDSGP